MTRVQQKQLSLDRRVAVKVQLQSFPPVRPNMRGWTERKYSIFPLTLCTSTVTAETHVSHMFHTCFTGYANVINHDPKGRFQQIINRIHTS
jgi:hypothetical protein